MTVSSTQVVVTYTGDGNTITFVYPFRILDAADLKVYLDGVLQSPGLYTVSGVGSVNGGTVTFNTAPPDVGVKVTLLRLMEETQLVDYQPFDAFPAETHEMALDKLTMLIQQQNELLIARAVRVSSSELIGEASLVLPGISARANTALTFDAGGNVVVIPIDQIGISDHGLLTGLADDDHPQYFNQPRGDGRYLQLAGGTMAGDLLLVNNPIPLNDYSAVPKVYADATSITKWHQAVRVASTAPVPYNSGTLLIIDGVQTAEGDRVLVKDNVNTAENGIFIASAAVTPWLRAVDADQEGELRSGSVVMSREGNTNAGKIWLMMLDDVADDPWTPDVDGASWTLIADLTFPTLDARYVNVDGDTMTGTLTATQLIAAGPIAILQAMDRSGTAGSYAGLSHDVGVSSLQFSNGVTTYVPYSFSAAYQQWVVPGGTGPSYMQLIPPVSNPAAGGWSLTEIFGSVRTGNLEHKVTDGTAGLEDSQWSFGVRDDGVERTILELFGSSAYLWGPLQVEGGVTATVAGQGSAVLTPSGPDGVMVHGAGGTPYMFTDVNGRMLTYPVVAGAQGSNAIGARFISTSDPTTAGQPATEGDLWLQTD